MRPLTVAVALVALLLVGMIALLWWRQERMVFFPPGPAAAPPRAVRVEYVADDGVRMHGYLVRPPGAVGAQTPAADAPVILHFHGNADLAVWQLPWAEEVARRTGAWVLAAEYRGYDGIAGPATYDGVQRDAQAAARWLRDSLGVAPERVILSGHSLGAAVAAQLGSELQGAGSAPAALLLHAPFTTARAMASRVIGVFAVVYPLIGRLHWDTEAAVRAVAAPVHVVHGADDSVIPPAMGRAVHAAARTPGQLLIVPGADHADLLQGARYWALVEAVATGAAM